MFISIHVHTDMHINLVNARLQNTISLSCKGDTQKDLFHLLTAFKGLLTFYNIRM